MWERRVSEIYLSGLGLLSRDLLAFGRVDGAAHLCLTLDAAAADVLVLAGRVSTCGAANACV